MNHHKLLLLLAACLFVACSSEEEKDALPQADLLRVTETTLEMTKEAGSRQLSVASNCDWEVSVSKGADWNDLTVQKTPEGLTLQTDANPLRSLRTATLKLTTKSGITCTVGLTQAIGDARVSVSEGTSLVFGEEADTRTFSISSNTQWCVAVNYTEGDYDWLTLSTESGNGDQTITVTAQRATSDTERKALIEVTSDDVATTSTVSVTQSGLATIDLHVSPEQLTFGAIDEHVQTVGVESNARWWLTVIPITPDDNSDWLQVDTNGGVGNGTIRLSCQPNTLLSQRRATIIVSSGNKNGVSERVNVYQQAATLSVVSALTLTSDPNGIKDAASFSFGFESLFPVTDYGLCYSTENTEPTTAGPHTTLEGNQTAATALTLTLNGLQPRQTYHVRAYAKSAVGTAYSTNVMVIHTLGESPAPDDNPPLF